VCIQSNLDGYPTSSGAGALLSSRQASRNGAYFEVMSLGESMMHPPTLTLFRGMMYHTFSGMM